MPSQTIQWFPGHMAKTRRLMKENLALVDIVFELVDARIPQSSRNPEIAQLTEGKPVLTLLTKSSLADPAVTKAWMQYYSDQNDGRFTLAIDCVTGEGMNQIEPMVRKALAEKLKRYADKGMQGRRIKAMIVGIPNVGKSTLINQISGRKGAKAENRPGVTRGKQWVTVDSGLLLLDTPGILWPKFEDPNVGMMLAYTGAVKENIIDTEELACHLMELLQKYYPQVLAERYKIELPDGTPGYELLEEAGRKRGYLLARGEIHTERMAKVLLDEYRSGKLGHFTLEAPEDCV
ncbi:MAG: ribosome biogenesis GTPase YlqF [Clostridia bacterium]|nr:ribosome biogenesis GTPase YlqF [Clostridia bacterium]